MTALYELPIYMYFDPLAIWYRGWVSVNNVRGRGRCIENKIVEKGVLVAQLSPPMWFWVGFVWYISLSCLVEEKRTHPHFTIHILLNNWKLCLYINTSHIFLEKSHFIFKHHKRHSRKFYAQTNFVFVCKTTGYCAIIIGKDGNIKSFHRFIRVFVNKCMTWEEEMDISRIYIYVLFFTHFSRNILAASLYTTGTMLTH